MNCGCFFLACSGVCTCYGHSNCAWTYFKRLARRRRQAVLPIMQIHWWKHYRLLSITALLNLESASGNKSWGQERVSIQLHIGRPYSLDFLKEYPPHLFTKHPTLQTTYQCFHPYLEAYITPSWVRHSSSFLESLCTVILVLNGPLPLALRAAILWTSQKPSQLKRASKPHYLKDLIIYICISHLTLHIQKAR